MRRAVTQFFFWLRHQFMEQVGADVTLHTWVPLGPSGFLMFLVESIINCLSIPGHCPLSVLLIKHVETIIHYH